MPDPDRLYAFVLPHNQAWANWLGRRLAVPEWAGSLYGLLMVAELALLVVLVTRLCAALRGTAPPAALSEGTPLRALGRAAAALLAAALFAWSVRVGSGDLYALFGRWDHLIFCAAAGFAISDLALRWRRLVMSALSLYFIIASIGWLPTSVVVAGGLAGFALLRAPAVQRAGPTALLQSVALLGTFAVIWALRSRDLWTGLAAQGPFGFVLLRHISFVVETRRGRSSELGDYLTYLLFYPSFIGATEIYSEFHDRNLGAGAGHYDYRAAARAIIVGQLLLAAGLQIQLPFEQVIRIRDPLSLWGNVLLLFGLAGLFGMGLWSTIEGLAYLYGVQLRPNFPNVLTCTNPAQFWRSWRATMTNWLLHYVYIPLGGNRRHQVRNIAAAFAVSVAWHWMGVPFFTRDPAGHDFVPIALWGLINATGVAGYVLVRRYPILPAAMPRPVRIACGIALTWVFATFTVTLLSFQPQHMPLFWPFLRTLLWLPTP
jgi:D-alanyl-lipoteichoic acid acyltransferase DltB (MBOAT superfamily)